MTEQTVSNEKVRELLLTRFDGLKKLAAERRLIDALAAGQETMSPTANLIRAMAAYISGDFNLFLDTSFEQKLR